MSKIIHEPFITLIFYNFFLKRRKFECFLDVCNSTLLLYKFFEDEIKFIMKIKGPFMIVMSLNKVVKHHLFKPNFDIGILFDSFYIFQYPYYSISTTFHDSHAIKVASHRQI
jgi:hypothetical protein